MDKPDRLVINMPVAIICNVQLAHSGAAYYWIQRSETPVNNGER